MLLNAITSYYKLEEYNYITVELIIGVMKSNRLGLLGLISK